MKKIYSFVAFVVFSATALAQAPQKMSYQAVIRDGAGELVTSSPIGMRISVLQGSETGTAAYVETQNTTSNANGLVTIEIGGGTVVSGSFGGIGWANGPYFIKTETDPSGGTAYTITGTSQLLSVPYALYALNSTAGPAGADGLQGEQGPAGTTGQNIYEVYGSGQTVVGSATTSYVLIPGLTQTINIPADSKVYVHSDGGMQSTGATASTFSVVDVALFVDGAVTGAAGQRRVSIANTTALAQLIGNWSLSKSFNLAAGSHTFDVRAIGGIAGSSNANVSSASAPQLQGVLTVIVVKQ